MNLLTIDISGAVNCSLYDGRSSAVWGPSCAAPGDPSCTPRTFTLSLILCFVMLETLEGRLETPAMPCFVMCETLAVVCFVMLDTLEGRLETLAMLCFVMWETLLVMLETFAMLVMLVMVFRRSGAVCGCSPTPPPPPTTEEETPSDASDPEMFVSV